MNNSNVIGHAESPKSAEFNTGLVLNALAQTLSGNAYLEALPQDRNSDIALNIIF
jgi:hypothetical protein